MKLVVLYPVSHHQNPQKYSFSSKVQTLGSRKSKSGEDWHRYRLHLSFTKKGTIVGAGGSQEAAQALKHPALPTAGPLAVPCHQSL